VCHWRAFSLASVFKKSSRRAGMDSARQRRFDDHYPKSFARVFYAPYSVLTASVTVMSATLLLLRMRLKP
jgi:hypothetical protein